MREKEDIAEMSEGGKLESENLGDISVNNFGDVNDGDVVGKRLDRRNGVNIRGNIRDAFVRIIYCPENVLQECCKSI